MTKKILIAIVATALAIGAFGMGAALDSSAQSIDARSLVELLIALGFIPEDKAAAAREAVSMTRREPAPPSPALPLALPTAPRIDSASALSGYPGDIIALSGAGFSARSKVYIGGISYDPLAPQQGADASKELSFALPSTPGHYTAFVANENGTTTSLSIAIVAPGSPGTQACGGEEPASGPYMYKGPGTYVVRSKDTPTWSFGIPFGGGGESCRFMCVNGGSYDGKTCSLGWKP